MKTMMNWKLPVRHLRDDQILSNLALYRSRFERDQAAGVHNHVYSDWAIIYRAEADRRKL